MVGAIEGEVREPGAIASRTAGDQRQVSPGSARPIRASAHATCSRTSGSGSSSAAASTSASSAVPTLPSTTAALRLRPRS